MNHGRIVRAGLSLGMLFSASSFAKEFPAVPGEFVVKIKASANIMNSSIQKSLGGTIKEIVSKNERLILVQKPVVQTRESALQTLSASPVVEYAEPNYIYKVVADSTAMPNDPELPNLWGMINTGQTVTGDNGTFVGKVGIDVNAKKAWEIETGSDQVIVAVIDTGVKWDDPDLMPNIYTNEVEKNGQAGVDDDNNGCVDDIHGCDIVGKDGNPMDTYGHGTHVSGTIGARGNDGRGVVGVAWNVKILPVRFLGDDGSGTLADAVKSIEYATAMKAQISNNSWGGGGYSQALFDVITKAKDAGSLFVAAAGNSAGDNDKNPEYPASYQIDNVVSVAAIDPTGNLASFSCYGKNSVHVAAPGVNIVSHTLRGLESWSGTSMASPHVAGVAALLLAQDLNQRYGDIKSRLLNSARPLGTLRGRVQTGLVDAYLALTNQTAPADPDDPYSWQKDFQTVSTDHPYRSNYTQEWTFTVAGANRVAVYFSRFETESGFDAVEIIDSNGSVVGKMSGTLGEAFSAPVDGDTVKIRFTTDGSVDGYGFDVGGIAYQ